MKWAVKIKFDEGTYLYVTEDTGKCDFDLRVKTFSSRAEAEQVAKTFRINGKEHNVEVIRYED